MHGSSWFQYKPVSGLLSPKVALTAVLALASAQNVQALPTQVFECYTVFSNGDVPIEDLGFTFRIFRKWEQGEPTFELSTNDWSVADYENTGSAFLELDLIDAPMVTEPGKDHALRITDGREGVFNDEITDRSQGSGVVNFENRIVEAFGVNFIDNDGVALDDHLVFPETIPLQEMETIQCVVEWRSLDQLPTSQNAVILGRLDNYYLLDDGGGDEDTDADGIADSADNCDLNYNPEQEDIDRDETGDACDLSFSRDTRSVTVAAGDEAGLISAINEANQQTTGTPTVISLQGDVTISLPNHDGLDAIQVLRDIEIRSTAAGGAKASIQSADGATGIRFARVLDGGVLRLENIEIANMQASAEGAAISVEQGGHLFVNNSLFTNNQSTLDGGAIHFSGNGDLSVSHTVFEQNSANQGGAIKLLTAEAGHRHIDINDSRFIGNTATDNGCDIFAELPGEDSPPVTWTGLVVEQDCGSAIYLASGNLRVLSSSISSSGDFLTTSGDWELHGNSLAAASNSQAACNVEGDGSLSSLGYNLSSTNDCTLDQATDQVGVNPMLSAPNAQGVRTPMANSPLVESGMDGVLAVSDEDWPLLPCGYRDANGLGRPQDANGDGVFECDTGAVEIAGAGGIEAGHSGVFFNPSRDGEGQFVEMLSDNLAVIYTFTFRPDGTGPAWMVGLGSVVGNSLVADSLIRPVGTTFGDDFDTSKIWNAPAGGMSMVFPDCDAIAQPGNVTFSGSRALGYEPVSTEAQRLTELVNCDQQSTPSENAGLSGTFFNAARDGEGLVIQWLPNGDVLAIMFTFDAEGNQMWVLGQGQPTGKSVTLQALYPAASTSWGSGFNAADVSLEPWGTFTLEYSDCDNLTFSFDSSISGYGAGQLDYSRVTRLAATSCPNF